ncbi:ABC transporter permease subunit [soil metagenome]
MSDFSQPTLSSRLGRISRLVRKETTGVLRDRRTIVTLFLMPLLLYPLLAVCFRQFFLSQKADEAPPVYRIGFRNEVEANAIVDYFSLGRSALSKLIEKSSSEKSASNSSDPQPRLSIHIADDLKKSLEDGNLDLGIQPLRAGGFQIDPQRDTHERWELLYREDSRYALDALHFVERLVSAGNEEFLWARLNGAGVRQSTFPVTLRALALKSADPSKTGSLAILIPLILILMTITGGVYPAIDLTAGERERGTLEILMAAPVPRLSLLFAKYIAVLTVALLTAIVNMGTMMVTLVVSGLGPMVFRHGLTLEILLSILALLVLFAGFFSAVLLALTSFARSFKEAQAYLIPLMLVSMAPGMLSLMPGIKLHGFLIIAPLINIVLLARDVLQGDADMLAALAVILSTSLYALAALSLAARLFGAEAVLFTDQGTWSDLWRRPTKARDRATPGAALFCLALLFPAYFVVTGGGSQLLQDSSLQARFAFGGIMSLVLFGGFPILAAYMGHIRFVSGFQLARPSPLQLCCGLSLGLGLWPFAHEITKVLKELGFTTLTPDVMDKLHESLVESRWISPLWTVVAVGIIPPIVEELFFRGYLLGAFLSIGRPIWAILSSAVLFGLFHLLVGSSFALERFVPTTLLGILLAWIAWRTGSIWPCIMLHITHNTLLSLMGYYAPQLEERGWIPSGDSHLSPAILATAIALVTAGFAGLWWSGRKGLKHESAT